MWSFKRYKIFLIIYSVMMVTGRSKMIIFEYNIVLFFKKESS